MDIVLFTVPLLFNQYIFIIVCENLWMLHERVCVLCVCSHYVGVVLIMPS